MSSWGKPVWGKPVRRPIVQAYGPPTSRWVTPNYEAVVCCIALDEELYIDEWIKYNLALGFQHIYIYDNSNNYTLKDKNSDRVTVIHFPGETKMLESRDIFTLQYKNKHKWCAFIDVDEFIVLKKHNNIIDFLKDYDYDSIALNWLMFGTSNEKEYRDEPVTSRFRYCSKNKHYKCISKLKSIDIHISPHKALIKGSIYDTNRKIVNDIFNPDGDYNIASIHHYWTKSEEEYKIKIQRRTPDETPMRSIDVDIHSQYNDVYNSDAWEFYSKT